MIVRSKPLRRRPHIDRVTPIAAVAAGQPRRPTQPRSTDLKGVWADRLTEQIAERKTRIRKLARHVMPLVDAVFTNKLGKAGLAVLERYGDVHALVRLGHARLTEFITKASKGESPWVWWRLGLLDSNQGLVGLGSVERCFELGGW